MPKPRRDSADRPSRAAACFVGALLFAGCHTATKAEKPACDADRNCVAGKVAARFGPPLGPVAPVEQIIIPPGISVGRPLDEDEAVVVALWNNAAFQEALVDLQLSRGDLIQAGLLPNPEFLYTFPAPNKPFKYLVEFSLESIFFRPVRVKAADEENKRVCDRLTQLALDLIRDTRQAYADLVLAKDRVRVAGVAVRVRGKVAELVDVRRRAGDASEQEAATARIDALLAGQDATRVGYEVTLAEERLRFLLGLSGVAGPLAVEDGPEPPSLDLDADALVADAVKTRPDSRAAVHAEAAAAARARFARFSFIRLFGILDATSGRVTGHEFSPALRFTVPIFNRNQGGIARADGELERAARNRVTVQNQIALDVKLAHARYRQARAEWDVLRLKVRPEVDSSIRRAEAAYNEGNVTYLIVLEATRQLIDTLGREATLKADFRRAWADLERGVGRKLAPAAVVPPPAPLPPPGPIMPTVPTSPPP